MTPGGPGEHVAVGRVFRATPEGPAGSGGRSAHRVSRVDNQQDSAKTPMRRRVKAALVGIVLALGLLVPAPVVADPVPAEPVPQATATATDTADGQAAGSDTAESTVAGGSLSRKKTIAALILSFVVALVAAVFVLRRSAQDNRLG